MLFFTGQVSFSIYIQALLNVTCPLPINNSAVPCQIPFHVCMHIYNIPGFIGFAMENAPIFKYL